MKDLILREIRRLAAEAGDRPPGVSAFSKATGITEAKWRGVLWARWGDALVEAGYAPNTLQAQLPENDVLLPLAALTRKLGRLPTRAEIKLNNRMDASLCSPGAVTRRYPTNRDMVEALRRLSEQEGYSDLAFILPNIMPETFRAEAIKEDGFVYLLRSGAHHKIGRSEALERRIKEITIALPEAVTLMHAIKTDDPGGIEAYWHRRFADRRANGEWFALTAADVKAFRRRTFQ